jgi:uncharacterized Zn-finger protein
MKSMSASSPLSQTAAPSTKNPEMIKVDQHAEQISCDGGGGALGHPRVWYNFGDQAKVECGYCDRVFVRG